MKRRPDIFSAVPRRGRSESGQTLLLGVVMLLVLTLSALIIFDMHTVIRAKLKVETAQQSAALAGAQWQKESLNLIGELNLIKACAALLEGENQWSEPLPVKREERRAALQCRIDHLSEMQTRIAFLGPLVGFAAAQQAAKSNGLPAHKDLSDYVNRLKTDSRYRESEQNPGGAKDVISGYRWREPYTDLVESIMNNGIAVYPNVRMTGSPTVYPTELASETFYDAIRELRAAIQKSDPPLSGQNYWHALRNFVIPAPGYPSNDNDYTEKWWDVDYSRSRFPSESEIYTLGVSQNFSGISGFSNYDDKERLIPQMLENASDNREVYRDQTVLPAGMRWMCYDSYWYPEYYRNRYGDYDLNHFEYWFKSGALRRNVKPQYHYEGPAAYAEGYVEAGRTSLFCSRCYRNVKVEFKDLASLDRMLKLRQNRIYRIGSLRGTSGSAVDTSGDYRPGSIAKALGELEDNQPPIAIPLVLPVFTEAALVPTYMPEPYGFKVLYESGSELERFLSWLAGQTSIFNPTSTPEDPRYLDDLRTLANGEKFRYYGWNPAFKEEEFDRHWKDNLQNWQSSEKNIVYSQSNKEGPGWFQTPKLNTDTISANTGTGNTLIVPDYINGGNATRVYVTDSRKQYYVVTSSGHIITNAELNPTLLYNSGNVHGHGGGYGGYSQGVDTQKGPTRL